MKTSAKYFGLALGP